MHTSKVLIGSTPENKPCLQACMQTDAYHVIPQSKIRSSSLACNATTWQVKDCLQNVNSA